MTAAEHGFFIHAPERVTSKHPNFPHCKNYDDLKKRILDIVMDSKPQPARELVIPAPLDFELAYRQQWCVICNVAGSLAPEPWAVMHKVTGIEALKDDTSSNADYDLLMKKRAKALRDNGIKVDKLFLALQGIEPFPGTKEFLEWLKPVVPRSFMISDSFEEYAQPVFDKLGHPAVFCNFIETDAEGYMTRHVVRHVGQKKASVEEFQRLNFRIIYIGHSFNDIPGLQAADYGVLLKPSDQVAKAHPEIQQAQDFEQLKLKIQEAIKGADSSLKRKRTE